MLCKKYFICPIFSPWIFWCVKDQGVCRWRAGHSGHCSVSRSLTAVWHSQTQGGLASGWPGLGILSACLVSNPCDSSWFAVCWFLIQQKTVFALDLFKEMYIIIIYLILEIIGFLGGLMAKRSFSVAWPWSGPRFGSQILLQGSSQVRGVAEAWARLNRETSVQAWKDFTLLAVQMI